jgi:hypothetical protein
MTQFETLPDSARVWVFASDRELVGAPADTLLAEVDRFLADWRAHGVPLRSARDWRENRFLVIGVDVNEENASGCSIDGLFRVLQELQREIGAQLLGGGRVFYRSSGGAVETATREDFAARAKRGEITPATAVFDTSLTEAGALRTRFEQPAGLAWTAGYFKTSAAPSS